MASHTHPALVTVKPSQPLQVHEVITPTPETNQVRILVEYTTTSPLDLHQAAGHLLVSQPPQILGSSVAGTVVELGPDVRSLKLGDRVFGYTFRGTGEKSYQLYVVTPETQLAKIPDGHGIQECVSIANNFVSAWHTITSDLCLDLPWPKPPWFTRHMATDPGKQATSILVWGGGSSVGQYALQILAWYGYKNITVVASEKHHAKLERYGATRCISYSNSDVVEVLNTIQTTNNSRFSHILDCIGSLQGSIQPLSQVAQSESKVAIFLPVIIKDAAEGVLPEYSLDVTTSIGWGQGVEAVGIRTHFYTKNEYLAEHLQSQIMPAALTLGIVEPNERIIVDGKTMLERAENALQYLKDKRVSGAKLVWKVAEDDQRDQIISSIKAQSG